MRIIPKQTTTIYFALDDVTEWIIHDLPQPTSIYYDAKGGGVLEWSIVGYFGTEAGREYLQDAIKRLETTLRAKQTSPKGQSWAGVRKDNKRVIELRELVRNCKSLPSHQHAPTRADSYDDYTFWAIKLWTEDEIRASGEGQPVAYSRLENWALSEFANKERSTIRAKCRSVWAWYDARGWMIPKRQKRKWKMTRSERAKANAKLKAIKTQAKVAEAIKGLEFLGEKITVRKVAEYAGVSTKTAQKYLKAHTNRQKDAQKPA